MVKASIEKFEIVAVNEFIRFSSLGTTLFLFPVSAMEMSNRYISSKIWDKIKNTYLVNLLIYYFSRFLSLLIIKMTTSKNFATTSLKFN